MGLAVHKFGGASVKDAAGVKNVGKVLQVIEDGPKMVIVSATGKTTNALEKVVKAYTSQASNTIELYQEVRDNHLEILTELRLNSQAIIADVLDTFVEIEWILEDPVQDTYDYIYDQIVSVGELVSSKILFHYCKSIGLPVLWVDVRGLIITDNTYREAKVNWDLTQKNIDREVTPKMTDETIVISQGFIGSSTENFTTTLGREGSDFSAGIFSYCLSADSLTIWKDVPGILTADPRIFENVIKLDRLSYKEAIEMTYYGAKVIHPKTIKPLQNKSIPLYVRPFNAPSDPGTVITSEIDTPYPPCIVIEEGQALIHISTRDFSFVAEEHLSEIFAIMTELNIKVNMMRNTAISFSVCVQQNKYKIEKLKAKLADKYIVVVDSDLDLITIRHYDGKTKETLTENKVILFEETIRNTIRLAVKDIPKLKRKA